MRKTVLVVLLLLWPGVVRAQGPAGAPRVRDMSPAVSREIERALGDVVRLYEWFHAHPELSGKEVGTSRRMAEELRAIGVEVHEGVGGHGVIGILRGTRSPTGPVVLYRADMDGLPIEEKTGLAYASRNPGVMHACGHDIHMATALGALRVLEAMQGQWSGTVLFVAQPAEEIAHGARDMLADPAFKQILRKIGKPAVALAIHDSGELPAGAVALVPGYAYANVDSVDIIVHGRGAHGARPHEAVDPIVIGAEIVMSLQAIVSRRLPVSEKAVITVGSFQAGTKRNIIPDEATLLITVRSYSDDTRAFLLAEIKRVAEQVARAHDAPRPPTVVLRDERTPSTYNDPAWVERLEALFAGALGKDKVERAEPGMVGEDFGQFSRELRVPGVIWHVGAVSPKAFRAARGKGLPGLHSAQWAPDAAPTLRTGVLTAAMAMLDALGTP